MGLEDIVDLDAHQIKNAAYQQSCRRILDDDGAIVLARFLRKQALEVIRQEGEEKKHLAYYATAHHNVYLSEPDPAYPDDHIRNTLVASSKGCITDDQIGESSPLRILYEHDDFRAFLSAVLGEAALYPYADDYSSINLHFADEGQELGWHFDNSSFATTLLIQQPEGGGKFEYLRNMRDSDGGDMNFEAVEKVLSDKIRPENLALEPGALTLFRGRNAIHRVTPTQGSITRMLAVLAYNDKPGIVLSASARKTFYGK